MGTDLLYELSINMYGLTVLQRITFQWPEVKEFELFSTIHAHFAQMPEKCGKTLRIRDAKTNGERKNMLQNKGKTGTITYGPKLLQKRLS